MPSCLFFYSFISIYNNNIFLTQRLIGQIEEYSSIGASAPIEVVFIDGIQGEYVEGGWRVIDKKNQLNRTSTPKSLLNMDVIWDPGLPQRTLRWQEGKYIFVLLSTGDPDLEMYDLIEIAESIE